MATMMATTTAAAALRRRMAQCASRQSRSFSALVSVEDEYPDLPKTSPQQAKVPKGSVTTLLSGLVVVTEDASPTSTVSLTFPKAGSAGEFLEEQGAALINKCLCFRSGSQMSTLMINRMIENDGGMPYASVDRYSALLGYTVQPDKAAGLLPYIAAHCSFEKWDVRDAKHYANIAVDEASQQAQVVLTENLYAAAYGPQSAAGRALYFCHGTTTDTVRAFRDRTYTLQGAVLTATGIKDHQAFCTQAEEATSALPMGDGKMPQISYIGGESRVSAPLASFGHVALAFEADQSVPSVVKNVVQQVFNIAGSDKGVCAFGTPHLVGMYAGQADLSGIVEGMVNIVKTAQSGDVIKRARTLAKAQALLEMDVGSQSLCAVMTAAVLELGNFSGPSQIAQAYDNVNESQVKAVLSKMAKSNPALAAVGNIGAVPYHASVAAQLK